MTSAAARRPLDGLSIFWLSAGASCPPLAHLGHQAHTAQAHGACKRAQALPHGSQCVGIVWGAHGCSQGLPPRGAALAPKTSRGLSPPGGPLKVNDPRGDDLYSCSAALVFSLRHNPLWAPGTLILRIAYCASPRTHKFLPRAHAACTCRPAPPRRAIKACADSRSSAVRSATDFVMVTNHSPLTLLRRWPCTPHSHPAQLVAGARDTVAGGTRYSRSRTCANSSFMLTAQGRP